MYNNIVYVYTYTLCLSCLAFLRLSVRGSDGLLEFQGVAVKVVKVVKMGEYVSETEDTG